MITQEQNRRTYVCLWCKKRFGRWDGHTGLSFHEEHCKMRLAVERLWNQRIQRARDREQAASTVNP